MGSRTVKIGTEDTNKVISLVHSQKKKKKKKVMSLVMEVLVFLTLNHYDFDIVSFFFIIHFGR